jgi:hypothetical protein
MQIGMIGLGRMGANMVRRLMRAGHQCAAYAEGFNILHHANVGRHGRPADAETTPLRNPEHYQYEMNIADIAEVWRRGSVVASWLLDLAAMALIEQPDLKSFSGRVSDSREGRWTITAAIDEGAPPGPQRRALPALRGPRRRRLRHQGALRDAVQVRGSRRAPSGRLIRPHAPTAWPADGQALHPVRRPASRPGGPRPARGR